MKQEDQFAESERPRYTVVPRTLTFLLHGSDILLLRGAPSKRLWAGKLNGVGGHVEADEDLVASARREVLEETGLSVTDLMLRGIIHISGQPPGQGVILFVFVGQAPSRAVRGGVEGELAWYPLDDLPEGEMVDDLPRLLPRLLSSTPGLVNAHYESDETGHMAFHFGRMAVGNHGM